MIRHASVCTGVGTDALAWDDELGWEPAWFAEIAAAPCAILAHRFPQVPNHGDLLDVLARARHAQAHAEAMGVGDFDEPDCFDIDLLAGGTPCQAFSFAGKRRSLEDARGNLTLAFCDLVHAIDAVRRARGRADGIPWVVWENVPGVLSTSDNAFGCFLAALVGADEPLCPDERWFDAGMVVGPARAAAYRVLDAQYFGLAQRRERVVVISCSRASGYDPAEVLFEFEGVRRDSPPSRGARPDAARGAAAGAGSGRGGGLPVSVVMGSDPLTAIDLAQPVTCRHGDPGTIAQDTSHALTGEGHDASEDGSGRGVPLVSLALTAKYGTCNPDIDTLLVIPISEPDRRSGRSTTDPSIGIGIGDPGAPMYTVCAERPHAVAQPRPFDTTNITSATNRSRPEHGDPCHPLAMHAHPPAVAFVVNAQHSTVTAAAHPAEVTRALDSNGAGGIGNQGGTVVATTYAVRRLMPVECERLQGLPDHHTLVPYRGKPMKDGPRYKAIGNGWARNVFAWVGRRIDAAVRGRA